MSSQASPLLSPSITSSMLREIVRIAPRNSNITLLERSAVRSPTIVDQRAPGPRRNSRRCFAASSRSSASFVDAASPSADFSASRPAAHHRRDRARLVRRARGGAGLGRGDDLVAELLDEHREAAVLVELAVLAGQRFGAHDAGHGDHRHRAGRGVRGGRGRARRCAPTAGRGRSSSGRTSPSGTARWPGAGSRPPVPTARRRRRTTKIRPSAKGRNASVAAAWPAPSPPMPGVSTTTRPCLSSGLGTVISTRSTLLLVARVADLAHPVAELVDGHRLAHRRCRPRACA